MTKRVRTIRNQFFPQQAATFEKQNSVTLSQQAARNVPAEIQKLSEQGKESDLKGSTPVQRLEMMWQLALDAWALKGERVADPRLPRHIIRVLRRPG